MVSIPEVVAYLPGRAVQNDEFAAFGIDSEWITTRTGISTRYGAPPGTTASDLAAAAARLISPERLASVDCVITTTATPDFVSPSTAGVVAHKLGLAPSCAAFDVSAACSGFVYGVAVATSLVEQLGYTVLLTSAEVSSVFVDPADKGTGPIFGDGAAAVVLTPTVRAPSHEVSIEGLVLGADGSDVGLVQIPGGAGDARARGIKHPLSPQPPTLIRMDGRALFIKACERMSGAAIESIERASINHADVDMVIPHQANSRIIDSVAELTGISRSKFFENIDQVGNTISASIPIALAGALGEGKIDPGHRVVISAFGGGTSWGAAVLSWNQSIPHTRTVKGEE
ncbi:beta-ketoacyl-ACP synthase 3 [Tsukamurella tyrosinosolvens]|uniref:3-oxoacyl-ACP synthase III family protein n=1 Tax=Tsukamurella tyrosinosolvens TaxID=57704 RepID=UPI0009ED5BAC|nr:beta-ketoacyl-ACP synthase 3 [Tsukamurella tyrosinosolvens]MCA4993567.1 beta-ketoacyl-ACP synthase 3 [Tsukamurella tyrosinosolvens]QRY83108.1 beta-ketoacyl-ACP synthase 3 [Tsukamurella tyrosinosolvens]